MGVAAGSARPRGRTRAARTPGLAPVPPPFEVVAAKISVPTVRADSVSRTTLVSRLKGVASSPVVTVAAPAGYGKTTLLAQWAARDSRPFAWVSIDERDNDPILLLRHVAAALHAIEPLDVAVLAALKTGGPSIWPSVVPRLGAALRASEPVVFVLDNSHLLRSRSSLEAVMAVADHVGESSVLVLSGRLTPRVPIAALRAAGRLYELEAEHLAFSAREGQLLLRATGAKVSFNDVVELVRHCEGWPAALYLAANALRDGRDGTRADNLLQFGGRDRDVADYLRSEYLSKLRPDTLRFLRRTSVVEPLSGALCDAVLQEVGSSRELEKIERANLFLVPLDRQRVRYRYHRLFRELLEAELLEHEPELVPLLHQRAADWYEARRELEPALEHADAAGDAERAARLITAIALPLYHRGRAAAVQRWLSRFDKPSLLRRYPAVAVQGSWVHALRGRAAEAEQWLQIAEAAQFKGRLADGSASLRPWTLALRAAMCGGGVQQMVVDAESALSALPHDSQVRPSALTFLGAAHVLLGQDERADAVLASAVSEAARLGVSESEVVALGERSLLASTRNDTDAAETFARAAEEVIERVGLEGYGGTALALAASARALLRHGRWAQARVQLTKVADLEPLVSAAVFPWFTLQTRLELVRAYVALRDERAARLLLDEVHRMLRRSPHVGVLADDARRLSKAVEAMPAPAAGTATGLTAAELRLLPFLATHLSFREIGERLFVSRNTIKTQAVSVYRKLGVCSRRDAIEKAASLGLIESGTHVV